ncbi:MAG: NAD-dependent succinate-semialdehyde dehydrogenase [Burkholderiales bacterium]
MLIATAHSAANLPLGTWSPQQLEQALAATHSAQAVWATTMFEHRALRMTRVAELLRERRDEFAAIITAEMGKLSKEALGEVEKCALNCDYYAVHAGPFLADEPMRSDAGKSYVSYLPLGTILGVMPWNFPFWQVFRFAAPALMAGNGVALKHASNVQRCAKAIESVFRDAGFPENLFTHLPISAGQVADAIASPHVHAVTLTGSEPAGKAVAAAAGMNLKKCVLELGGSDPFIVLADADLDLAIDQAVLSRYSNCGQSCIAAKRFILAPEIADEFVRRLAQKISALKIGDPADGTTQLGPMAREDLRDELHQQVKDSIAQGAVAVTGCAPLDRQGAFYAPSILDHVTPKTRAYHEELFGPVAIVIRARDEADAARIANDTRFGLASSIWSRDFDHAEEFARHIQAGATFINGMVKSDSRLPFGGIKASGFGRELSYHGIREFVNAKTIWMREGISERERREGERRNAERRGERAAD